MTVPLSIIEIFEAADGPITLRKCLDLKTRIWHSYIECRIDNSHKTFQVPPGCEIFKLPRLWAEYKAKVFEMPENGLKTVH